MVEKWWAVMEGKSKNTINSKFRTQRSLLCNWESIISKELKNKKAVIIDVETEWTEMDLQVEIFIIKKQVIYNDPIINFG